MFYQNVGYYFSELHQIFHRSVGFEIENYATPPLPYEAAHF